MRAGRPRSQGVRRKGRQEGQPCPNPLSTRRPPLAIASPPPERRNVIGRGPPPLSRGTRADVAWHESRRGGCRVPPGRMQVVAKGERTVRGPPRQPLLASLPQGTSTSTFLGKLISRSSSSSIPRPFRDGFLERKEGKIFRKKSARSFSIDQRPRPSSTAR